jgi:hypothetical protein
MDEIVNVLIVIVTIFIICKIVDFLINVSNSDDEIADEVCCDDTTCDDTTCDVDNDISCPDEIQPEIQPQIQPNLQVRPQSKESYSYFIAGIAGKTNIDNQYAGGGGAGGLIVKGYSPISETANTGDYYGSGGENGIGFGAGGGAGGAH